MQIKDRVVTWWIQNILIPRREIIDKPGFVVTTFTDAKTTTYLRDLFLPEQLFESIENKIVERYGDNGKQALYSAGKKFSYIYCSMSNFPTISIATKEEFANFAYLFVRYISSVYAKDVEHKIDFEDKSFTLFYDGYIVCRHNGLGYIMTDGGAAGTWAYVMENNLMEGTQLECQGRGNDRCHIICALPEKIKKYTDKFFCEKDLPIYRSDTTYKSMNEIRQTKYAMNSLKDLLNSGFFRYDKGILSYKDQRFFHCEPLILDFLEQEICKLENGEKILFDACLEFGKSLGNTYGGTDYHKFISDFFPALGFGDILAIDSDRSYIISSYYPWTIFSKQSRFIIFRGIMSGIASNILKRNIEFKNFHTDIKNYLVLTIST